MKYEEIDEGEQNIITIDRSKVGTKSRNQKSVAITGSYFLTGLRLPEAVNELLNQLNPALIPPQPTGE